MIQKETIESISAGTTYGASSIAVLFGLTANEIAALGGLIIACLGFIVNLTFKLLHRQDLQRHYRELEDKNDTKVEDSGTSSS